MSMDMKDPSDVPFYMFIEATGDSEADCNNPTTNTMAEYAYEIGFADDDAQSCSCDNSEDFNAAELKGYEFLNDDEDEGKAGVYGTSYCEDDEMQEHQMKSFVSDDSSQELVDEKEKNRLFWEACLAS